MPACDRLMLNGLTGCLLGASSAAKAQYRAMQTTEAWQHPLAWAASGFTLDAFDLVFLPGGHEKSVRQVIDSAAVHALLAAYFPQTRRTGGGSGKVVAAVCHGVMVLSASRLASGASVLHDSQTTALPTRFEQAAYWGTRLFLGDYYKTYGAGSENVEESVCSVLFSFFRPSSNSLRSRKSWTAPRRSGRAASTLYLRESLLAAFVSGSDSSDSSWKIRHTNTSAHGFPGTHSGSQRRQ